MVSEDPRQPITQNVTAIDGFAYGVIGADIHVFGDGLPLYLLERWRPPPEADPDWLRELPSRMLNARFAVVEFTGRADELENLCRWRTVAPVWRPGGYTPPAGKERPGSPHGWLRGPLRRAGGSSPRSRALGQCCRRRAARICVWTVPPACC